MSTYRNGNLMEYGARSNRKDMSQEDKREWFLGLAWYAAAHNYKPGLAFHKCREKSRENPERSWGDGASREPRPEVVRWIKSRQIAWANSRNRCN
ncbi:MAG: hypothetical protein P8Y25_04345 [Chromatiaceae bacterium]